MRILRICAHGAVASLCFVLAVGLYTALAQPAKPAPSTMTPPQGALRVGMTPNFPPMVFTDQGTITGLEADFAREVGKELARRMVLIELHWKELIPALEARRIDVNMSGMSITETRKQRVRFVQPYQRVGQMALLRKDGPLKLGSPTLLTMTTRRVGFEAGTTGAKYVLCLGQVCLHVFGPGGIRGGRTAGAARRYHRRLYPRCGDHLASRKRQDQ